MPTDQQIQDALNTLAQAEAEGKQGIKRVCVINKSLPKGFNTSAVTSYYKEKYALEAKKEIDHILADKEIARKIYPKHCKLITAYQRIVQGQMYLVDHLDPEGIYKAAKPHIEIRRLNDLNYMLILWKETPQIESESILLEDLGEELSKIPKWKEDLEDFIQTSSDGDVFLRRNVHITEEDEREVRGSIMNLAQFHIKSLSKTRVEIRHRDLDKIE